MTGAVRMCKNCKQWREYNKDYNVGDCNLHWLALPMGTATGCKQWEPK